MGAPAPLGTTAREIAASALRAKYQRAAAEAAARGLPWFTPSRAGPDDFAYGADPGPNSRVFIQPADANEVPVGPPIRARVEPGAGFVLSVSHSRVRGGVRPASRTTDEGRGRMIRFLAGPVHLKRIVLVQNRQRIFEQDISVRASVLYVALKP